MLNIRTYKNIDVENKKYYIYEKVKVPKNPSLNVYKYTNSTNYFYLNMTLLFQPYLPMTCLTTELFKM